MQVSQAAYHWKYSFETFRMAMVHRPLLLNLSYCLYIEIGYRSVDLSSHQKNRHSIMII
jgi:hypothetical protein